MNLSFEDREAGTALVYHSCCYILELEDEHYYVGITHNLNLRMAQHWAGVATKWTALHKPVRLVEVIYPAANMIENATTLTLMECFGFDKVRGGAWTKLDCPNPLVPPPLPADPDDALDLEEETAKLVQETEVLDTVLCSLQESFLEAFLEFEPDETESLEVSSPADDSEALS